MTGDASGIYTVRLRKPVPYSDILGEIAISHMDIYAFWGKFVPYGIIKGPSHNSHKGGIPEG